MRNISCVISRGGTLELVGGQNFYVKQKGSHASVVTDPRMSQSSNLVSVGINVGD